MATSSTRHGPATSNDGIYRHVRPEDREAFAAICSQARDNLAIAIDMILVHNERDVRGPVPRTSLNLPIISFSVAAWERLITDLRYLTAENLKFTGAGEADSQGAYLTRGTGRLSTLKVLDGASDGHVPKDWLIYLPTSGSGKSLRFGTAQQGASHDLADSVDFWIRCRNHVVHRRVPGSLTWAYESDASDSKTFNTTMARIAMTTFLQMIDQTIGGIAAAGRLTSPEELRLPKQWLDGQLIPGERGVTDGDQLRLWNGRSLLRVV
jgi:hypothetical protein